MGGCLIFLLLAAGAVCSQQSPIDESEAFALQLVDAPAQQREELLAGHPKLITIQLRKALVRRANGLFVTEKYAPAFELYRLAQRVAQQVGDKEGLAETALNIGSVYYSQGKHGLAVDSYRQAQELFTALANRSEAARSVFGLALTYQAQQKLPEALESFKQALSEFETLHDANEIANTLAAIGGIQYAQGNYDAAAKTFLRAASLRENGESLVYIAEAFYRQHDYANALVHYQRSLAYFEQQKNAAGMISALNGSANCFYYQRNYEQALALYQRSLNISERLNDKSGIANQLQNIGNVHRARGDYGSALQSYLSSLSVAREASTKINVANTLGSVGLVRSLQGDNIQAVEYFEKSLKEFEASGDEVGMARMLSYIGNVQYVQGQYDLALAAYERSLALYRSKGDKLNEAHILLGIGTVYLNKQKFAASLENYQQGLALYESLSRNTDSGDALTRMAVVYRLQGEYAKGLEVATKAVALSKNGDSASFYSMALTELGRLQRGLNRTTEALNTFTEAITVQRSINAEAAWAGAAAETNGVLPYLGAMEILIDQNNPKAAFERAEDAKSQNLRQIIQRSNVRVSKEMTAAEQQQETKLLGDLVSLRSQIQSAAGNAGINPLKERFAAARTAYESFRKQLYAKHPRLPVNRGELAPLNLEEVSSFLPADTAVAEYAVTESHVFLFVITTGYNTASISRKASAKKARAPVVVKAYPLSVKPAELAEHNARFLQLIASRAQATPAAARELYVLLLKPAESQIATKAKLIIVPDSIVWDVPFAPLQSADNQNLVDQKTLSYAISVSALREMRKRRPLRPVATTVLALGNPMLTGAAVERFETTYKGMRLPEFSGDIDELRTIYARSRSHFYVGPEAKKERAKSEAGTHSLLHFATPVIMDQAVPFYSFILLTADVDAGDDGMLKLWEVMNFNSRARLVVLPSATTARTSARSANAFMAMSWAWFVAGTPNVMVSRWSVDPLVVQEFAAEFHRNLRMRKSNAEALRDSMRRIKTSTYDWGAFILIGAP